MVNPTTTRGPVGQARAPQEEMRRLNPRRSDFAQARLAEFGALKAERHACDCRRQPRNGHRVRRLRHHLQYGHRRGSAAGVTRMRVSVRVAGGKRGFPQPPHDALRRPGFESKRRSPGILRRAPAIRRHISMSAPGPGPRAAARMRARATSIEATGRRSSGAGSRRIDWAPLSRRSGVDPARLSRIQPLVPECRRRIPRSHDRREASHEGLLSAESLTDVWRLVPATG
jgi:hypothetical protein